MLGFCVLCILGSDKYSRVVPGVQRPCLPTWLGAYIKFVFALSRDYEWGLLVSQHETGNCYPLIVYRTLAKCAIRKSLQLPKRHAKTLPLIVQAVPCTPEMRGGGFVQDVCLQ